ncbi:MAG: cyclodeaminase/cyclohydrolase family protein [Clostridiales Family XIII bacterium]|jgi:formiminotetrahydrofolate cyclodeaminase|nr:cyclodeaminase/cyclohydrolase family protein [Clostridiales Family XIII bacterium]
MTEFIEMSVRQFVSELSGKRPTPGGGGASALVGAVGIALGGMVANLTIGKKKYADAEEDMKRLKVAAYRIQKELLALISKDAEAFGPLAGAYRMPTETEEERASKMRVMEAALKESALIPLEMMKRCAEAIDLLGELARKGSKLAVSDAACGAILCKAALQSAWLNVCVNTMSIRDRAFSERTNEEGRKLIEAYSALADEIYAEAEYDFTRAPA